MYRWLRTKALPEGRRSGWGQGREEKEAKQGYDFRWSLGISLMVWGLLEHSHTAAFILPFEAKEPGFCTLTTPADRNIPRAHLLLVKAVCALGQSSDRGAFNSKEYRGWGTEVQCLLVQRIGERASGQDKPCSVQQALKRWQALCLEHLQDEIGLEIWMVCQEVPPFLFPV